MVRNSFILSIFAVGWPIIFLKKFIWFDVSLFLFCYIVFLYLLCMAPSDIFIHHMQIQSEVVEEIILGLEAGILFGYCCTSVICKFLYFYLLLSLLFFALKTRSFSRCMFNLKCLLLWQFAPFLYFSYILMLLVELILNVTDVSRSTIWWVSRVLNSLSIYINILLRSCYWGWLI